MKYTKLWKRALALAAAAALALCLNAGGLAAFAAEGDIRHIGSQADLLALAADCTLDSASKGLTVELDCDLFLTEEGFSGIPTFDGIFHGNNHTISGFSVTQDGSAQGLFRYLQEDAVVSGLVLRGNVSPGGSHDRVGGFVGVNGGTVQSCTFTGLVKGGEEIGGIAGQNLATGRILACEAYGIVYGEHFVGGIVGDNQGLVERCTNKAGVNTTAEQNDVDISTLTLEDLTGTENAAAITDIGGIAGGSAGVLRACENSGHVGYSHVGYNIGGIAGSQTGYIEGCVNRGTIEGRKEVGGIVGQMEPSSQLDFSKDTLQKLSDQMEDLQKMTNKACDDAEGASDAITGQLSALQKQTENAAAALDSLMSATQENTSVEDMPDVKTDLSGVLDGEDDTTVDAIRDAIKNEVDGADAADTGADTGAAAEGTPVDTGADTGTPADADTPADPDTPDEPKLPEVTVTNRDAITAAQNALSGSLTGVVQALGTLGSVAGSENQRLADDIRNITDQMNLIGATATGTRLPDAKETVQDVSDADTEQDTTGKVYNCINTAAVEGDLNVGGIAGAMAVENDLDPEDDVDIAGDASLNASLKSRTVLRECTNTGAVTAKKQAAGGIVGRMEMGSVIGAANTGAVSSDGSYVGGIAGRSKAVVRESSAKCRLSGADTVGGIAGEGATLTDCRAMVKLDAGSEKLGAIAGVADDLDKVTGNCFVTNESAGVDGVSYAGRAEPLSYHEFAALENLPELFKTMTLRFAVEGEVVATRTCAYGGSVDVNTLPVPPEKAGSSVVWADFDDTDICFDATIEAVYTGYRTVLESAEQREGRALLLAGGAFVDGDALVMTENPAGDGVPLPDGSRAEAILPHSGDAYVESWTVRLPEDGQDTHTFRYLPETDEGTTTVWIAAEGTGAYRMAETGRDGSYVTFEAAGDTVTFCVTHRPASKLPLYVGAGAGALAVLGILFLLVRRIHARRAAKKAAKAADEAPDGAAIGAVKMVSDAPDETPHGGT